ncbi:MAG: nucleoside deaminase [Gemmatimonadota bacterium]
MERGPGSGPVNGLGGHELEHLRAALRLAERAKARGDDPFGAVLVDGRGAWIAEAMNTLATDGDCTGHAEINLVREVSPRRSREELARCTLYASAEPCPMCSGAIFWSGIGRIVYAIGHERVYALLRGGDALPIGCREILARGSRDVEVVGPVLEDEASAVFDSTTE